MYIVLYQPEIAPNTGNIARTCAAVGCPLHLIEPLGFQLEDRKLKRAGLDYWPEVQLTRHTTWAHFMKARPPGRLLALSVRGQTPFWDFAFAPGDGLVFGCESRGLPPEILAGHPSLTIPMGSPVRSLNLAVSVGIVLYEALRQNRDGLTLT
ncbi:tRNA (cytidine(34)-2'-O)-methyltransferase [Anthocerotibacter panamensis]|uniref:tRNA (cytidine(34)-2'-O)-methyltransferase n=1 Tax=Anthocerotibacter panamensis TaxID=2857077 RepID=UPI001C401DFA|nr:tRNA (cytidine(34)-2'-O)-methyltransferase [Anthocerotibacter panamensis]